MAKRPNQGEDEAVPNLCPIDSQNHEPCAEWRGPDLSGSLQGAGGIGGLLARTDMGQWIAGSSFATTFYHSDANGNVTSMVYPNGFLAAKYLYDPFGNMLAQSGSLASANRYRFSSKEWDSNSGLYYYLYRFYDPNLQRWLSRDPMQERGGLNLYDYVRNNPVNFVDPFGLMSKCDCKALRQQIFRKALDLLQDLDKYDPIADGRGGFPSHGGGTTKPGGHYQEIKERQQGIKNDIGRYVKECIQNNDDNNPSIPKYIDDYANQPVEPPLILIPVGNPPANLGPIPEPLPLPIEL